MAYTSPSTATVVGRCLPWMMPLAWSWGTLTMVRSLQLTRLLFGGFLYTYALVLSFCNVLLIPGVKVPP